MGKVRANARRSLSRAFQGITSAKMGHLADSWRCGMRKLILNNYQSPGDIVMLTAAVRDLHRTYPGDFLTDVRGPPWEVRPLGSAPPSRANPRRGRHTRILPQVRRGAPRDS